MAFLVDEDVDVAVGGLFLKRGNDVQFVVDKLGSGAKDPTIRVYLRVLLRAGGLVLITADNTFAAKCSQEGSRLPCLWLRDLHAEEFTRTGELADVIEREAELMGRRFFMEVRAKSYIVRR